MRDLALSQHSDFIRFPYFAIIFGKSNCGKISLINTLMTSMFGYRNVVGKRNFTASKLRALQQGYKRFPVVFDDIARNTFNRHGRDMIKDDFSSYGEECPGFVLSMNAEPQSLPDEVVKHSMVIYTMTSLPLHNKELRQQLQGKVQDICKRLTGHLYRRYLSEVMITWPIGNYRKIGLICHQWF